MLEPREADIPALFLVLVVLPLVAYFLLGKWSDSAKKRERINLLAHLAAQEARRAEAMAVADVIPPVAPLKNVTASTKHVSSAPKSNGFHSSAPKSNGFHISSAPKSNGLHSSAPKSNGFHSSAPKSNGAHHACARCFNPATTRCAKCKSVRYCSGKCQIIHWRDVHKQECGQMEFAAPSLPPMAVSIEESFNEGHLPTENMNSNFYGYNIDQMATENVFSENIIYPLVINGVSATIDSLTADAAQASIMVGRKSTERRASRKPGKEASRRKDSLGSNSAGEASSKESQKGHKSRKSQSFVPEECATKQNGSYSDGYVHGRVSSERSRNEYQNITMLDYGSNNGHTMGTDFVSNGGNLPEEENTSCIEQTEFRCSSDTNMSKGSAKTKRAPYSLSSKSSRLPKSTAKESADQFSSEREKKDQVAELKSSKVRDSYVQASNEGTNGRIMKMMGLGKSAKLSRKDVAEHCQRTKMLFPYEEFMKFFQCEVYALSPRGLLNCGNSCYANAVLQCLTSTKPLTIYLLHRSHSRACCGKDWCLMCELEQHVTMLKEIGGPLSPSRILLQMRSINCHIGDGNQEDAHEFLRLLVASMQAICLEGLGGENKVDPRLQETTFIQHTFGGHLRSKVKCLRCHHESERYENIMDLTLEIYGWVESLEDALTQFTTPEDLDGENMYRCGRCANYVRARKQLSIHEAPNILTIVLKRFQEGRYGKINKCITFPDMLDMIPFMTGTGDAPPLYLLYAVVVHLDTLNASFSGHYVSYVKDLRGNWFRIDDTEVQPVSMSQVMSEGAYILFYMRSCPRPHGAFSGKVAQPQAAERNFIPKTSRAAAQTRPGSSGEILRSANQNSEPMSFEFSDAATSSDWSLFTSSDDASFTTESTRDSFSTDFDPASSIFATPDYARRKNPNSCRNKMAQTRFFSEEKGHILDSYLSAHPLANAPPNYSSDGVYVTYGSNQNTMGLN